MLTLWRLAAIAALALAIAAIGATAADDGDTAQTARADAKAPPAQTKARPLPRRYRYTTVDYPGSLWSTLSDINDKRVVVGDYSRTTTLDTPLTVAEVRSFTGSVNPRRGLARDRDSFTVTGSDNTSPLAINNNGDVVGYFYDEQDVGHGFLRSADSGTFTAIDHPSGTVETGAFGINDTGTISGFYIDSEQAVHGFLRAPDGQLTDIDHPRGTGQTYLRAIDNAGTVVGHYRRGKVTRAFVRTSEGTFDDFRLRQADTTCALAINEAGQIAGFFIRRPARRNIPQGFVRSANGRRVVRISHPRGKQGTMAFGINERGDVVGFYTDADGVSHGFLATPRR